MAFNNTCIICGETFEEDEEWKTICLKCYKAGNRQRKDGRTYKIEAVPKAKPAANASPSTGTIKNQGLSSLFHQLASICDKIADEVTRL